MIGGIERFRVMLRPCKSSKIEAANCVQDIRDIRDDLIGRRPDEILQEIVSRLTLRDVVKASVLSSKWRDICSSSQSSLVFNWVNVFQTSENIGLWESWRSPCHCGEYKDAFIRSVNQFLGSYRCGSTKLSLFEVTFALGRDCQNHIDDWIKFALQAGAEELELNLQCDKRGFPGHYDARRRIERNDDNKYVIPSYNVLSRGGKSMSFKLQHLYLRACKFQRETKSYRLLFSHLPGDLCLGSLVSLEGLGLKHCPGIEKLRLPLKLASFRFSPHVIGPVQIEFHNPSGSLVPSLECLSLSADDFHGLSHVFTHLPKRLPNLHILQVQSSANWVLVALSEDDYDKGNKGSNTNSYIHEHLRRITFCGFYNTPHQIEFCLYMLQHAPCLQYFIISHKVCPGHSSSYVRSRPSQDELGEECQKIHQRLQPFSRDVQVVIR
ncbi:hypothetical protein Cgig2_002301 [Carnegiea gigantea]|uniref:F-box domain-containing protein n=1 Tax=Carnegiea gigantea TaxID=171969 RepID=A0A9Q1QPM4_9CARY|nr:hypothetical protein Cgig2_002301 [Carnegiea gigantea]